MAGGIDWIAEMALEFDRTKVTQKDFRRARRQMRPQLLLEIAPLRKRQAIIARLDKEIPKLLKAQNRKTGSVLFGAFAPVRQRGPVDIGFAERYVEPIHTLAQGYALPGSRYYHDPQLIERAHLAFVYMRRFIFPGCPRSEGLYTWVKAIPQMLIRIAALMGDALGADDRAYIVAVVDDLIGISTRYDAQYNTSEPAISSLGHFTLGLATGDAERIARVWEGLQNHVAPYMLADDGAPLTAIILPKYLGLCLSYAYHSFEVIVTWARCARGTCFQLRPETIDIVTRYLLGLARWNTFRGTEVGWISLVPYRVFWPNALGRSLAPGKSLAGNLAQVKAKGHDALRGFARGSSAAPIGCHYWPKAETLICRTRNSYCSLVMSSRPRGSISYVYKDRLPKVGNKWYYGRDGHLVIARNKAETSEYLTYTTNWARLSGTTADDCSILRSDQMESVDQEKWQPLWAVSHNPLAGAAVLSARAASAGIEVKSGDVLARKSFLFLPFRSTVMTLASHIRGHDRTHSTVHSFPVGREVPTVLVNGRRHRLKEDTPLTIETPCWVHVSGTGYWFPDAGQVTILTEVRQPDFEDRQGPPYHVYLPPEIKKKVTAQRFVSILCDHGNDPRDAGYACAYLFDTPQKQMPNRLGALRRSSRMQTNEHAHLVRCDTWTGIVFFRAGEIEGYRASRPCVLALRRRGCKGQGVLFNPSWQTSQIELRLPGAPTLTADGQRSAAPGKLRVRSCPGKATPFTFHLPNAVS